MSPRDSSVASPRVVNIGDLRRAAERRLPRAVFDYIDGGADGEVTLRENTRAFEEVVFRPRNAVFVHDRDTRTKILGCELSMPLILAPVGFSRLIHAQGEISAARAAGKAGVGFCLTTISGCPLEKVAAATACPRWYQLYLVGGREAAEAALARAWAAGFTVLAITIDTGTFGFRERDIRNGASTLTGSNSFAKIRFLPNLLSHPGWLSGFIYSKAIIICKKGVFFNFIKKIQVFNPFTLFQSIF